MVSFDHLNNKGLKMRFQNIGKLFGIGTIALVVAGCGGGGGGGGSTPPVEEYTYTLSEMNNDIKNFDLSCVSPKMYILPLEGHWAPNDILSGTQGKMFVSGQTSSSITIQMIGIETAVVQNKDRLGEVLDSSTIRFSENTKDALFEHMENCIEDTEGIDTEYTVSTRFF